MSTLVDPWNSTTFNFCDSEFGEGNFFLWYSCSKNIARNSKGRHVASNLCYEISRLILLHRLSGDAASKIDCNAKLHGKLNFDLTQSILASASPCFRLITGCEPMITGRETMRDSLDRLIVSKSELSIAFPLSVSSQSSGLSSRFATGVLLYTQGSRRQEGRAGVSSSPRNSNCLSIKRLTSFDCSGLSVLPTTDDQEFGVDIQLSLTTQR